MRSRLNGRANRRVWGRVWFTVFRDIAEQEFLQFPDCLYVRLQIRFEIRTDEILDWKPMQISPQVVIDAFSFLVHESILPPIPVD